LSGFTFGLWGLAFEPGTDDMREVPSIDVIKDLVKRGAKVKVYEPKAIQEAEEWYLKGIENIEYCSAKYEVLKNAAALILLTERKEFRAPDFEEIKAQLIAPVIFDGRNQYNAFKLKEKGFE
jgi:UDPglucose 6-dehydrogenase